MAGRSDTRPLRLHPRVLIIPAAGGLRVVHSGGRALLAGDAAVAIHGHVGPLLDGRASERDLLAAVPAGQRPALGAYLDGLRGAGAFDEPSSAAAPSATELVEMAGADVPLGGGAGVQSWAVAFDGPSAVDIWYASADQPEDVLADADALGGLARPAAVVLVGPRPVDVGDPFLLRYAEALASAPFPARTLWDLDRSQRSSRRLFTYGGERARGVEGPLPFEQLPLVRPADDLLQLPLAAYEAGHELLVPRAESVGGDPPVVRDLVLDHLLAEVLTRRPGGWAAGRRALREGGVSSDPERARLRALQRAAARRPGTGTPEVVDLLDAAGLDATDRYLLGAVVAGGGGTVVQHQREPSGLHRYHASALATPVVGSTEGRARRDLLVALAAASVSVPEDVVVASAVDAVAEEADRLERALGNPRRTGAAEGLWGRPIHAITIEP